MPAMIQPGTRLWPFFQLWSRKKYHFSNVFSVDPTLPPELRAGSAKAVLLEFARYCHALSPTTSEREQGRRDVWIWMRRILDLSEEELCILYADLSPESRHQLYKPGATYINE